MEIDRERLRRLFPHLAEELENREGRVGITSIRSDADTGERASSDRFAGYTPDVIDFIRRCDNERQAMEIIEYLEARGEIDRGYAQRLRRQLREKGVRSFGPKKEEDYYLKRGSP